MYSRAFKTRGIDLRQRRHSITRTLDVLGKWSLIDMYVLCIMVIAFPVHVVVLGWDIQVLVEVCRRSDDSGSGLLRGMWCS
jgi:hypothetical protein